MTDDSTGAVSEKKPYVDPFAILGVNHTWDVDVIDLHTNSAYKYRITTKWDPEKDFVLETVVRTAAAMAAVETNHKHTAQGVPQLIVNDIVQDNLPIQ